MKRYKNVAIILGLSPEDPAAIRWTSTISKLAESERVTFIHPIEVPEIPDKAKQKYPWLVEPLDKQITSEMKAVVEAHWDGFSGTELVYEVLDHKSPVLAVLKYTVSSQCDLVIVDQRGFGHDMAIRLARKAPCSVMIIPDGNDNGLERILVPTDFSEYSANALDVATAFASAEEISAIDCIHVYDVGFQAHRAAVPKEELQKMALEYAQEKHAEFTTHCDNKGVSVNMKYVHSPSMVDAVIREVNVLKSDLVVVGCRGKGTVAALLLGSNAEELLRKSPVPVIAAKSKGSGLQLINALLSD